MITIDIKTLTGNTATPAELLRDLAACINESSDKELNRYGGSWGWSSAVADSITISVTKDE